MRYDNKGVKCPLWQPYNWIAKKVICMNCGAVNEDVEVTGMKNPEDDVVFVWICNECYKKGVNEKEKI
jgi:ribosomal protein L40E